MLDVVCHVMLDGPACSAFLVGDVSGDVVGRVARELDRRAREWELEMYQVSLAWLLSRPAVVSVIVGAETVDELRANASAADVELTPEQLDAVSALTAHLAR